MAAIRMAQFGTKHGHAPGKLLAMQAHPDVEFVAVYETDAARRAELSSQNGPFAEVDWVDSPDDLLNDPTIAAIASEGSNAESLDQTEKIVAAGKHVWYDKPAGENWDQWQRIVGLAQAQDTLIQMGYMFRYHEGFCRIADWAKSGLMGDIFSVRAHMSTAITAAQRPAMAGHSGGIFYDLAGHMLDQIVWLLGRPLTVTAFLRHDDDPVPGFVDNALGVFEFERALAFVDIAAMETRPMARRFEVYGSKGSAILVEPFEPAQEIRLCLADAAREYVQGEQRIPVKPQSRQSLYALELDAFLSALRGDMEPDRTLAHELLVQETLLRATGGIGA